MTKFKSYMDIALREARLAASRGEIPVGAVVILDGQVIAQAGNRTRELNDPTAHAEVLAIRAACSHQKSQRLVGAELYVTLEPCPMCAAAIANARIARLFYGASDPKSGGIENGPRIFTHPQCHHKPDVYDGISQDACARLLSKFFEKMRSQ